MTDQYKAAMIRADGSRVVHCSVIMTEDLHKTLRAVAKTRDQTISAIVRLAVLAYLEHKEAPPT